MRPTIPFHLQRATVVAVVCLYSRCAPTYCAIPLLYPPSLYIRVQIGPRPHPLPGLSAQWVCPPPFPHHLRMVLRAVPLPRCPPLDLAVLVTTLPLFHVYSLAYNPTMAANPIKRFAQDPPSTALQRWRVESREYRLCKLQELFERLESLINNRVRIVMERQAEIKTMKELGEEVPEGLIPHPGAESGLLGLTGAFDTYLCREYRSCLEQAAKEMGQWDVTGAGSRETGKDPSTVIYQHVNGGINQQIGTTDPRPGAKPRAELPQPSKSHPSMYRTLSERSLNSEDERTTEANDNEGAVEAPIDPDAVG